MPLRRDSFHLTEGLMRISALGPKGSFSELAAIRYADFIGGQHEIRLYPTILAAFEAAGNECDESVVPIENMLEGHVSLSLDLIAGSDLHIVRELMIPVGFSFVGNATSIDEINKVYIQSVTQGQCRKFLKTLPRTMSIETTPSNSASFDDALRGIHGEGAIVPRHMVTSPDQFRTIVHDVHDHPDNMTRFAVLSGKDYPHDPSLEYKTSIVILDVADEPGALYRILGILHRHNLNLTSIISRPNREAFGKYYFFMDIDSEYPENEELKSALDSIRIKNRIKVLGSYSVAKFQ